MYQNYKSLKQNLRHQQVMVGTFVMEFAVPQMATILASAGADYLIIDLEHTMFSLQTVGSMIRAARGSDIQRSFAFRRLIAILFPDRLMREQRD